MLKLYCSIGFATWALSSHSFCCNSNVIRSELRYPVLFLWLTCSRSGLARSINSRRKSPRLGISSARMSLLLPSCLSTFTQLLLLPLGSASSSSFSCAPVFDFDCSSSLQIDHCSGLLELFGIRNIKIYQLLKDSHP